MMIDYQIVVHRHICSCILKHVKTMLKLKTCFLLSFSQAYLKDEVPSSNDGLHPVIVFVHGGMTLTKN